jgi:hypothetical protein
MAALHRQAIIATMRESKDKQPASMRHPDLLRHRQAQLITSLLSDNIQQYRTAAFSVSSLIFASRFGSTAFCIASL